jgi:hypothetical protein
MLFSQSTSGTATRSLRIVSAPRLISRLKKAYLNGMEQAVYRCSRCRSQLDFRVYEEPLRCSNGCGEWLTFEAVDEHSPSFAWASVKQEPDEDGPRCALCAVALRCAYSGIFYRCAQHGIWLDGDAWQRFMEGVAAARVKMEEAGAKMRAERACQIRASRVDRPTGEDATPPPDSRRRTALDGLKERICRLEIAVFGSVQG